MLSFTSFSSVGSTPTNSSSIQMCPVGGENFRQALGLACSSEIPRQSSKDIEEFFDTSAGQSVLSKEALDLLSKALDKTTKFYYKLDFRLEVTSKGNGNT